VVTRAEVLAGVPDGLRLPAGEVLDWVLGQGCPVGEVAGYDMLQFVWYGLPTKWMVDEGELAELTAAAAAVMEAAGRGGVAGVIRSGDTPVVQRAWRSDRAVAVGLFERAMAGCGYGPPDTELLVWGSVMGVVEVGVHAGVARVLERAIEDGVVVVGRPGWRRVQAGLAEAWLSTPSLAHGGRRPVEVVHAERRQAWLRSRAPAHRLVLEAVLPLLDAPPESVEVPAEVEVEVAGSLRWLLARVGDGLVLTPAGYLPTAVVAEAKQLWFGDWQLPGFVMRSESDLPPLMILREFARRAKLLTRRGRRLTVSKLGRTALADPGQWLPTVAAAWFSGADIEVYAAEVAAALMLQNTPAERLLALATEALAPRFRHRDGSPADRRDVEHAVWEWLRPGNSMGLIAYDRHLGGENTLTASGRAAAILGLRLRAHAPLTHPG